VSWLEGNLEGFSGVCSRKFEEIFEGSIVGKQLKLLRTQPLNLIGSLEKAEEKKLLEARVESVLPSEKLWESRK
jgi:hypothetical protein